jgi:aminoglycoside 6-adenylyltransferase
VTITIPDEASVLQHLVAWATGRDPIRTVLLTSTRAVAGGGTDPLSDYDVVLIVTDVRPFHEDRRWIEDFGEVLVTYWDSLYPDPDYGIEQTGNVIQYAGGLKIDFTVSPVALLQRMAESAELPAEFDAGYRVLLDKDGMAAALKPPTYRAYLPERPTNDAFQKLVEDFFSDAPYVAKCLWRDDLLPAKWCLDYDMRYVHLYPVLEWLIALDSGWTVRAGLLGKGLKKRLPHDLWAELEASFAGGTIEENWESLFRTMALFGRAASRVAAGLGYTYPRDLEARVAAYAREVQMLPRG